MYVGIPPLVVGLEDKVHLVRVEVGEEIPGRMALYRGRFGAGSDGGRHKGFGCH